MRTMKEIGYRLTAIKLAVDQGMYLYQMENGSFPKKKQRKREKMIQTMLKKQPILKYLSKHELVHYDENSTKGLYPRITALTGFEERALPILYLIGIENDLHGYDTPFADAKYYEDIFFGDKNSIDKFGTKFRSLIEQRVPLLFEYYNNLKAVQWRIYEKKFGYKSKINFKETLAQLSDFKCDFTFFDIRQDDLYFPYLKKRADKLTSSDLHYLSRVVLGRMQTIEWLLFEKELDSRIDNYENMNLKKLYTPDGIVESPSSLL